MLYRKMVEPTIRIMTPEDGLFALEQTEREGWGTTVQDLAVIWALDSAGSFIATFGPRPVALTTTACYGRTGWIGNVIVEPGYRRRGIARKLMRRAVEHLRSRGAAVIGLEADPPGVPLYRSLGFVEQCDCDRFHRPGKVWEPAAGAPDSDPLTGEMFQLDTRCFGDDRSNLLRLLADDPVAVLCDKSHGVLQGYLMIRESGSGLAIGPWVAQRTASAMRLLEQAVDRAMGASLLVRAPATNHTVRTMLEDAGFEPAQPSLRMFLDGIEHRGEPEHIYAIAHGALG